MREAAIAGGVASVAGRATPPVQIGVELAPRRPHSRQDGGADQRGLKTLGRAGYAQSAIVSFMEKL